jgi:hypothetical protein
MVQIPDTHCAVKSDGKKDQNKWMLFKISSYSLIKNDSSKGVDFVPYVASALNLLKVFKILA